MVDGASTQFADLVAVRDGSTTLTYAELAGAARDFGAALVAQGFEPGDRVAIWCGNCAEWTVAALGLFAAGALAGAEIAAFLLMRRRRPKSTPDSQPQRRSS